MRPAEVLFVDDEQRILDGLQRGLRHLRSEWSMHFAGSGSEALALMARQPIDILVTDMRMPGMDGATLLEEVTRRWPACVRLILSGHTDQGDTLRAIAVAHQFLSKPCRPEEVERVIRRVWDLAGRLQHPKVAAMLGAVGTLPPAPSLYLALMRALDDPRTTMSALAAIVGRDEALAAKLLQLVNSSFFGQRRRIADVAQAASLLGITILRAVALSHGVIAQHGRRAAAAGLDLEREQRHAQLVAEIARRLAPTALEDEAFTAGLLHDIGRLILLPPTEDAPAGADDTPCDLSHVEIGAALLGYWGLPYPIVEAVAYHPHPLSVGPGLTGAGILHAANALAHRLHGEDPRTSGALDPLWLATAGGAARWAAWESDLLAWRDLQREGRTA